MEKEVMQNEECRRGGGYVLLSFLAGGIIGAGITLLAVSKHGEGMKNRMRKLGDEAKQKAGDYIEKVKAGAASVVELGKEVLEQERSIIDKAVEAGKEILEQQKSVISSVADMGKRGK